MSLAQQLRDLGFTPVHPITDEGDFVLQDDSDGHGPYIREWRSEEPCPFPELLREPHA
jgi:hypothetical protein